MHLHLDRSSDILHNADGLLLLLSQKRIKKFGLPNILTKLAMFEEDMHCLPQCVAQNLHHLLVHEGILCRCFECIGTRRPRQSEGHGAMFLRGLQSRPDLAIPFRRPEAHDDIVGPHNRVEPGLHQ